MAAKFKPELQLLQGPQRRLWGELRDVPGSFVLCGGTAVALHLGHRQSVDFDFLGSAEFDPDALYHEIPFLKGTQPLQKSASTLTCLVDRGGPVRVSFFGAPPVRPIESPLGAADHGPPAGPLLHPPGMTAA